ncbi:MAG: pantothenate kinase [Methanomassiliicoccaceae archaeon]|nr:pantothenate kinase [Methanomassiliicoccaceae archaeon]
MIKAFCPGHITCFFAPVITDNMMTSGSVGAGIRLNKGVTVTLEERIGNRIRTIMDGKECDAKISASAVKRLAPGRGFDIVIENDLPVSQGMGTSAAGAIASGLCVSSLIGIGEHDAYKAAHIAEVENGGGLGDVAGIIGGCQTIRVKAGLPPFGRTIDTGISMKLTVAVLGREMNTKHILSDTGMMERITKAGMRCVSDYSAAQSEKVLYELSSEFSRSIGLETDRIKNALSLLRKEHRASMCMLGNSIFTDASEERTRELLGDDALLIKCSTGSEGPMIIRKA